MMRNFLQTLTMALAAPVLIAGLTVSSSQKALGAEDIVVQAVDGSFDKVVTNLKREITGHKLVIVKEVPYQKMLGMVGVKAEKMLGFEIFHPRYGKVLYETDPAAFMDAPLRILVREADGGVRLEYRKPSVVFSPYSGLSDLGQELDEVFSDIVMRVAG